MIKIAVCEDDRTELEYVCSLVRTWAKRSETACEADGYVSAEQLLYSFDGGFPYAAYILDIQMGGMNGMELARKIRRQDEQAVILFLTGIRDYALEGYEVGAARYLMKPLREGQLYEALDQMLRQRGAADTECFLVELRDGIRKIPYRNIWYVESQGHYVELAYGEEKIQWKAGFGSLQSTFEERGFVLARRGLLVNLCRVARVGKTECVLDSGETVPVSRGQYKKVNEAFIAYYRDGRSCLGE